MGVEMIEAEGISNKKSDGSVGIGMDSAVIPLSKHPGLSLVQTVDFFYPLIDDPFKMGKIAFANVASDIYACGVTIIDKITLVMSSSTEFTDKQRDVIVPMMIAGFKESCNLAGCKLIVGNVAENPWIIIGGVATAVCSDNEIILPTNAIPGDLLVLTKPLGTQLATNAYTWMIEDSDNWKKLKEFLTVDEIQETFDIAVESMSRLNLLGSKLMHKYNAHAATDVTGFGLVGHADNLAKFQNNSVSLVIHDLPIIKNVVKIGEILQRQLKLVNGRSVETSGGLLICMPKENAKEFCEDYNRLSGGHSAWIIGFVEEGDRSARVVTSPNIINATC